MTSVRSVRGVTGLKFECDDEKNAVTVNDQTKLSRSSPSFAMSKVFQGIQVR